IELPALLGKLEQGGRIAPGHALHHGIVARHVLALAREQTGKIRPHHGQPGPVASPAFADRGHPLQDPRIPCAAGHINLRHVHGNGRLAAPVPCLRPTLATRTSYPHPAWCPAWCRSVDPHRCREVVLAPSSSQWAAKQKGKAARGKAVRGKSTHSAHKALRGKAKSAPKPLGGSSCPCPHA